MSVRTGLSITVTLAFTLLMPAARAGIADGPSVDQVKGLITEHLRALTPQGVTERDVAFQDVRPGTPYADVAGLRTQPQTRYPFQVTLALRDYEPGYPPNHYFGSTCVSHLTKSVFTVTADDFDGWAIEGAWTPTDKDCTPNPPR